MMQSVTRFYSWADIERLIYADCGLASDEDRRTRGEMLFHGLGAYPDKGGTFVEVRVFDKPFAERIREHAGE